MPTTKKPLGANSGDNPSTYRADSGNPPEAEGWVLVDGGLLAGGLEMHGFSAVVMPEEWTGPAGSGHANA